MKIKSKYKKIFLILIILLVTCFTMFNVQAQVTSDKKGGVGVAISGAATFFDSVGGVITAFFDTYSTGVFYTITRLTVLLELVLFLVLYVVFAATTSNLSNIPMPDTIVFNRLPLFDPNFVVPSNSSLAGAIGEVLRDIFASFQTIAITVFVIAAMIVGIQIAMSTVAAKKAQYKEAAVKWIVGLLLLISIKWIVAGVFYLNEILVSQLYKISSTDIKIPIYVTDMIAVYGQQLSGLVKTLESVSGLKLTATAPGYFGLLLSNMCKGVGGNLVATIVGFVILGQTLTIIGSYLKRLFMSILLGVIAPLVVAVDSVNSAIGKTSNIFKNWLKSFTVTVFMQSIHALYMVVIFQMLSKIYTLDTSIAAHIIDPNASITETQLAILVIVLTTGLVKMEKMIKSVFGIGDSFAGELKDGSKGIVKAMGAVKGLTAGLKAVTDNTDKEKKAGKNKQIYAAKLAELKATSGNTTINNTTNNTIGSAGNPGTIGLATGGSGGTPLGTGTNSTLGSSDSGSGKNKSSGDFLQDVLNEGSQPRTREEKIKKLEEAIGEEMAKEKSARLARIMGASNLIAGLGIGIGMGDEINEALFKGGHITQALDFATEKTGERLADKDRRSFAAEEAKDGKKYDYTPSEKIIREKTVIEKTIDNKGMYVNPVAIAEEWKRTMSDVADVFTDQVKKRMKEIDRDLDNN